MSVIKSVTVSKNVKSISVPDFSKKNVQLFHLKPLFGVQFEILQKYIGFFFLNLFTYLIKVKIILKHSTIVNYICTFKLESYKEKL